MSPLMTRRRALAILACGTGAIAVSTVRPTPSFEWHGIALGADASLLFQSASRERAEEAVAAALAEVDRLEAIFSLYLPDSEISRLNREGRISAPSLDLCSVLDLSRRLHSLTEGLFDPTVQPLWRHYAELALGSSTDDAGGTAPNLYAAGMVRVAVGSGVIRLPPGAAITLNGIAQGYITDRVADILRLRGWTSVLADLGEVRALEGRTFDVLVRGGSGRVSLAGGALATSATEGTLIGPGSGISHVLHPRTGRPAHRWRTVTVRHGSAAVADGVSTALLLADRTQARRILSRLSGASAWATTRSGSTVSL